MWMAGRSIFPPALEQAANLEHGILPPAAVRFSALVIVCVLDATAHKALANCLALRFDDDLR